jgi:hypothetical protein
LVGRIDGFPRGQRLVGIGVEIFCQILSPFPKLGIPQPFLFCTFDDFPRGQKLIGFGVEIRPKIFCRAKEEVHAAICNLDQLTSSEVWIAPADPLVGVAGSKGKKRKVENLPTETHLVLSDGEVDTVDLDDKNDADED